MINRIKNKIHERQEKRLSNEIINDLINYTNHKYNGFGYGSYGICKKYNLKNEIFINKVLRTYTRKLNIAKTMETEKRIQKTQDVLDEYRAIILEQIKRG